jgi:NAD(P)-dependent dehydrogenase (short-subunit alcohol dehydrogenase family)
MRFNQRTAVVTDAAQGIGLATAKRLAEEGVSLVVADGITVNTVAPSTVVTEAVAALMAAPAAAPARAKIISTIPAGRAATMDEVAAPRSLCGLR